MLRCWSKTVTVRLREPDLFSLERRLRGVLIIISSYLKGATGRMEPVSWMCTAKIQGAKTTSCSKGHFSKL